MNETRVGRAKAALFLDRNDEPVTTRVSDLITNLLHLIGPKKPIVMEAIRHGIKNYLDEQLDPTGFETRDWDIQISWEDHTSGTSS